MTREQVHELVADIVADAVNAGFDKLRADVYARILELRTPHFALTPKGELYVNGELAGDLRPVFESVSPRIAQDVLAALKVGNDDGDDA